MTYVYFLSDGTSRKSDKNPIEAMKEIGKDRIHFYDTEDSLEYTQWDSAQGWIRKGKVVA